jgi:hypothetical protein
LETKENSRCPVYSSCSGRQCTNAANHWGPHAFAGAQTPIPVVLHCPRCYTQHIDAPKPERGWTNPPHRSHLCGRCGLIWRPADVETVGVECVATRGQSDTWPAVPAFSHMASPEDPLGCGHLGPAEVCMDCARVTPPGARCPACGETGLHRCTARPAPSPAASADVIERARRLIALREAATSSDHFDPEDLSPEDADFVAAAICDAADVARGLLEAEADYRDVVGLLVDCVYQFSIERKDGKLITGCLSTMEAIFEYLGLPDPCTREQVADLLATKGEAK